MKIYRGALAQIDNVVVLEITSFIGLSSNAMHYYGKLVGYLGNAKKEIRLDRTLRKSDAIELTKHYRKDNTRGRGFIFRPGMSFSGFNSRDDVIEKAIEVFNSDFPDGDILVEDDPNEVVDQFLNVLAWGKGSQ